MIVDLEDERNLTHEFGDARLEHSERRRERVAAGVDSELKMVARIVRGGIIAKLRAGPCSKPWSTGRITNLPVPASLPWFSIRDRLFRTLPFSES